MLSRKTDYILLLFFMFSLIFLLNRLIFAWLEPIQNPPNQNVATPLNTSNTPQTKLGTLTFPAHYGLDSTYFVNPSALVSAVFRGNVGINNLNPDVKLAVGGDVKISSLAGGDVKEVCADSQGKLVICSSTYTLSVYKSGSGSGRVTSSPSGINCGSDCSESYNSGTTVTLTATPDSGSTFAGWSGDCSGTGSCTLTMNSNKAVVANFNSSWSSGSMVFKRATIDSPSVWKSSTFVLDNTTSFIAFTDYNPSRYAYDLKFGKSTDQGGTFSISVIDNTNSTTAAAVKALNQNTVFVAYVQRNPSTGYGRHWKFAKSDDGGLTWSIKKTLESIDYAAQYDEISLAVFDANNIAVIYHKYNEGLRVAKSSDGGLNWTIVTADPGTGSRFFVYEKSLDEVGNYAFAAYYDYFSGDLKFLKTTNAFSTFSVGRVDEIGDVGLGASLSAVDANTIFIVYGTYQSGAKDLKLAKSLNGGTTWQISTIIPNNFSGGHDSVKISLKAINANNIIFAFNSRNPNRSQSYNYLRLAISNDGGNSGVIYEVEPDDQGVYSLSIDALSSSNIYILYSWGSSYNLKLARNF
mgnify:CR=1 FL=1